MTALFDVVPAPAPAEAGAAPRVLGADLSLTSTGLAGDRWTDHIRTGKLRSHDRLQHILDAVETHLGGVDLVAVEGPSLGGGVKHRHEESAWLRGLFAHRVWQRRIPLAVVPPSNRILYALGHARPKGMSTEEIKAAVRDAVAERYGVECAGPARFDEADAFVVRAMALDWMGFPLAVVPERNAGALVKCAWPVAVPVVAR